MAADLHDLTRLKVTAETRAWLQAEAHTSGRSMPEIAREALHEIAVAKIRAAKVLASLAPAEVHTRDDQGPSGDASCNASRNSTRTSR